MEQAPGTPTNFGGLDEMITKFANANPPASDPTPAPAAVPPVATPPAAPVATPPVADGAQPAAPAGTQEPAQPFDPNALFGSGKQNAAFAQMRTQNAAMSKTLGRVAQTLGITATDPEAVVQALERRLNEHQATETGVPLEMLERLDTLTKDTERRERELRVAEANRGFQRVKDEHKLTDSDLAAFAKQLQEAGKNPFETPMDLTKEYILFNYEKMLNKAKEDAVTSAQQRQAYGQQHSTQPGTAAPAGTPGTAKPVTSVAELDALFAGFKG